MSFQSPHTPACFLERLNGSEQSLLPFPVYHPLIHLAGGWDTLPSGLGEGDYCPAIGVFELKKINICCSEWLFFFPRTLPFITHSFLVHKHLLKAPTNISIIWKIGNRNPENTQWSGQDFLGEGWHKPSRTSPLGAGTKEGTALWGRGRTGVAQTQEALQTFPGLAATRYGLELQEVTGWVAQILPWLSAGNRPTISQGWSADGGLRSEKGKKPANRWIS